MKVGEKEKGLRKKVFTTHDWMEDPVNFKLLVCWNRRGFHATQALRSPPSKTSKGSQINSDHHAPSALGWWGVQTGPREGAQSLLLASCSFPGTRRPEPRRTDGVPQFLPPALSSPLSLLIHLFGWIGSRMEPRWIIMSFLITPCICIPCYSLHGSSWLKWIIYIINIWL